MVGIGQEECRLRHFVLGEGLDVRLGEGIGEGIGA